MKKISSPIRPVSQKVYNDITSRINSALSHSPASAAEALSLTDAYLAGTEPVTDDPLALLAFNMIRAELDRAMERSRRARQRAACRKAKSVEAKPLTCAEMIASINEICEKATEEDGKPRRKLNRRERRELERQIRRSEKIHHRSKARP